MSAALRQLSRRLRGLVPPISSLGLVVIGAVPLGLPHFAQISPALALMAVFYWSIFRADLMSMLWAFAIGLAVDLLTGGPLGMQAVILLAAHALAVSQRRIFLASSFVVNWWGFGIIVLGAGLVSWLLACLLHGTLHDLLPVLAQMLLAVGLYPMVYWVLNLLERRWLRPGLPV